MCVSRLPILKRRLFIRRTISAKNSTKKQLARHKKQMDEKQLTEKRKKRSLQRRKTQNFVDKRDPNGVVGVASCNDDHDNNDEEDDDNDDEDGTANLNRVLVERMLLKNSGFNQGSRSVGGTPICLRRKKHDVNKNLSPLRLNDKQSPAVGIINDPDAVKRRSNSVRINIIIDHNDRYICIHLFFVQLFIGKLCEWKSC